MTRKEQEKLGKEIVERLNKGEKVGGFNIYNISNFYNIRQFHYIKIEEINSKEFSLIVLPEDNDGDSFLEMRFLVEKSYLEGSFILNRYYSDGNNSYFKYQTNKFHCFTKFKLTGNYWEEDNLDYWLVRRNEKFRWIREKLKIDDPEYNLAMYELYGFSKEYIKRELNYYDTNL